MRIAFLSFLSFLILQVAIYSQDDKKGDPREKIESLEKIKLLETLNLDEDTAVKFFARRNEHKEKMKALMDEQDAQYKKIEDKLSSLTNDNDPSLKKMIDSYLTINQKMDDERKRFFDSLSDILTLKQQAKLAIFEKRFRQEIRDILFHRPPKEKGMN
jgi:hypothetical protein